MTTNSPLDFRPGSTEDYLRKVRPARWNNPIPKQVYDLAVIGAGPAVLTATGFRANLAVMCGLWLNEDVRVAGVGSQNGGPSSETGSEGCGGGDCVKR